MTGEELHNIHIDLMKQVNVFMCKYLNENLDDDLDKMFLTMISYQRLLTSSLVSLYKGEYNEENEMPYVNEVMNDIKNDFIKFRLNSGTSC